MDNPHKQYYMQEKEEDGRYASKKMKDYVSNSSMCRRRFLIKSFYVFMLQSRR